MMPDLSKMPATAQSMFKKVMKMQMDKGNSEATAMKVAWEYVKTKFKQDGDVWIARTGAFDDTQYYTFEAEPAEGFITRTKDGVEIHNYTLTDIWPDAFGTAPTPELLNEWASWINENQPEADTDHELYEKAKTMFGGDIDKVSAMLKSKKGFARAVKAQAINGKLTVSLAYDKRYANYMDRIKGLSIEAAAVKDTLTNKFKKGKLLGFTLALNHVPANPRAVRQ